MAQLSARSILTEGAPSLLLAKVGGKTDGSFPALVRVFREMRERLVVPAFPSGSKGTTMNGTSSRPVEAKIARLAREIADIDRFFYGMNKDDDRSLYAGMLERKRDDMVRSAVLQLHTAIEDLLNSQIICCVLKVKPEDWQRKMRNNTARALRKMLFGGGSLGFDMKLNFAVVLGLLNTTTKDKLAELNMLRNKCGHNWLLKVPVRRGRRPRQKSRPCFCIEGATSTILPSSKTLPASTASSTLSCSQNIWAELAPSLR